MIVRLDYNSKRQIIRTATGMSTANIGTEFDIDFVIQKSNTNETVGVSHVASWRFFIAKNYLKDSYLADTPSFGIDTSKANVGKIRVGISTKTEEFAEFLKNRSSRIIQCALIGFDEKNNILENFKFQMLAENSLNRDVEVFEIIEVAEDTTLVSGKTYFANSKLDLTLPAETPSLWDAVIIFNNSSDIVTLKSNSGIESQYIENQHYRSERSSFSSIILLKLLEKGTKIMLVWDGHCWTVFEALDKYFFNRDLTAGLELHYPLINDANDTTANGFDGIPKNIIFNGDSAEFNGVDSYIKIPHFDKFLGELKHASIHVKYELNDVAKRQTLLSMIDGRNGGWNGMYLYLTSGYLWLYAQVNSKTSAKRIRSNIAVGDTGSIGITIADKEIRIFHNGAYIDSITLDSNLKLYNSTSWYLGRFYSGSDRFNGRLKNYRMYSETKTDEEMKLIHIQQETT